jgi:hypothetical protein
MAFRILASSEVTIAIVDDDRRQELFDFSAPRYVRGETLERSDEMPARSARRVGRLGTNARCPVNRVDANAPAPSAPARLTRSRDGANSS